MTFLLDLLNIFFDKAEADEKFMKAENKVKHMYPARCLAK